MNYISIDILKRIPRGEAHNKKYNIEYYNKIKKDISENGIKEPLFLKYYVKDNALRLIEGHHRIEIALELELKKLPIRILVDWTSRYFDEDNPRINQDVKGQPIYNPPKPLDVETYKKRNYWASEITPSEIGLSTINESNYVKVYVNESIAKNI